MKTMALLMFIMSTFSCKNWQCPIGHCGDQGESFLHKIALFEIESPTSETNDREREKSCWSIQPPGSGSSLLYFQVTTDTG